MTTDRPRVTRPGLPASEGSIVIGWLTKLAVGLAIAGLIAFDGLALITARVSAADHAAYAASDAADEYKRSKNPQLAYNAAAKRADQNKETVETQSFTILPASGHVTLTLHKTATTLWLHRIGFLKKYTDVKAIGEGNPPLS